MSPSLHHLVLKRHLPRITAHNTTCPADFRRRSGHFEEQHGYQSQLLLPVDPQPAASSSRLAASVDSSLAAHERAAVNLTSASPALATPAEQVPLRVHRPSLALAETPQSAGVCTCTAFALLRNSTVGSAQWIQIADLTTFPVRQAGSSPGLRVSLSSGRTLHIWAAHEPCHLLHTPVQRPGRSPKSSSMQRRSAAACPSKAWTHCRIRAAPHRTAAR